MRVPTSEILTDLMREAPAGKTTLAWIVAHLKDRSFGIVMLLIGVLAMVPGISLFAGVLLAWPAIQMMLGHEGPVAPGAIARRGFSTPRLIRVLGRAAGLLRRMERVVRPRWGLPFEATKRIVGFLVLLLGLTLLAPIPFSQVIPGGVIILLAFAWLEEDGLLLVLALAATLASIAVTSAAIWGTIEAGLLIHR